MNDHLDTQQIDSHENTDDVVYEASPDLEAGDDLAQDSTAVQAKLKDLRTKLAASQKENMDNLSGWQRAKADLINANRRHEEERVRFAARAEEAVIEEFLPILDSFDMAMANKEAWEKIDATWRMGIEHIRTQALAAFARFGVEPIDPIGQKFDPTLHNSLETVATDRDSEDNTVVHVVQRGYRRGDAIIRPASVKVASKA